MVLRINLPQTERRRYNRPATRIGRLESNGYIVREQRNWCQRITEMVSESGNGVREQR
jgi:hypothetical protein